ncbi:hypothetical protein SBA1_990025 [Candidatus Sulfotelmatobacter kueseliae]|uniref:Uncharacterized protein n=1 Tax=Candidatus Sulfotelmatobacter kueseliae TaxID=2042962 RepID=A0A2U3LEL7_9BACT|nr:hypothetical protein SBA1_990025 [Candidatus Sulfotelmatobacter kueseliae]
MQTLLIGQLLPTPSYGKSQTRKKTKRKTKVTAKKMRMMTRNTMATRSERTPIHLRW